MSKIEQLIQEIEEYIDTCPFQPLSNKAKIIVNKEELEELLVELRLKLPDEIKKYQKIISNQDAILTDARKQAASMLDEATAKSSNMLNEATVQSSSMLDEAAAQYNQMMADADAQTKERVDNHQIMQQVYEQANQMMADAEAQAQAIVDRAAEDADNIRQGAIQYTDSMLRSLQAIITHAMDTSQSQFDTYMNALKSNYDIATSNRNELAGGLVQDDGEQNEQTEDAENN